MSSPARQQLHSQTNILWMPSCLTRLCRSGLRQHVGPELWALAEHEALPIPLLGYQSAGSGLQGVGAEADRSSTGHPRDVSARTTLVWRACHCCCWTLDSVRSVLRSVLCALLVLLLRTVLVLTRDGAQLPPARDPDHPPTDRHGRRLQRRLRARHVHHLPRTLRRRDTRRRPGQRHHFAVVVGRAPQRSFLAAKERANVFV